ncbi:MAG: hypothetical protein U1E51_07880, partial [Candidatus Binatia bacterium]|nr:hypothetical protein [Candidatus Binatia bacterium]
VVVDTGSASGRKHYRCPECGATWREKNAAAAALGRLGGLARASNISKERAEEIASSAANTRWGKEKNA